MKKIIYSDAAKIIAILICIVSVYFVICEGVTTIFESKDYYCFEESFEVSNLVKDELGRARVMLENGISEGKSPEEMTVIMKGFDVNYFTSANGIVYSDGIDTANMPESKYCVHIKKVNGITDVIADNSVSEDYMQSTSYKQNLPNSDFEMYIKLKDSYVSENEAYWRGAKNNISEYMNVAVILMILALISGIYLLFVCGRKSVDHEIHTILIDRMYSEITVFLLIFTGILGGLGSIELAKEICNEAGFINQSAMLIALICSATAALMLTFLLSIVRKMKNCTFIKHSIIWLAGGFIFRKSRAFLKLFTHTLSDKKALITVMSLALYTIFMVVFFMMGNPILMLLLAFGAAALVMKKMYEADRIIKGIFEIRGGNTEYKIEGVKGSLSEISDAVNSIGDGISDAVEVQMKSERMKSELITNVSHDLKTPLTSIINYSDLLCGEKLQPKEANDYAQIIRQKGERLKKITADLFDISKVQSGNEVIKTEKIDICQLITQALGELDEGISKSGLEFVNSVKNDVFALGDGQKLSRVFENLIGNTIKYSMKNSRVYIDVREKEKNIIIEIKNISAYPMNFNCDEITERFVRGDKSRTEEGSGLGLAIAKSYVEACGGAFEIIVDGDLFKAVITLKKCN